AQHHLRAVRLLRGQRRCPRSHFEWGQHGRRGELLRSGRDRRVVQSVDRRPLGQGQDLPKAESSPPRLGGKEVLLRRKKFSFGERSSPSEKEVLLRRKKFSFGERSPPSEKENSPSGEEPLLGKKVPHRGKNLFLERKSPTGGRTFS